MAPLSYFAVQYDEIEQVSRYGLEACTLGYNEFDFFLENEEYGPFDGCKIEI
jgi:hypothetical protein